MSPRRTKPTLRRWPADSWRTRPKPETTINTSWIGSPWRTAVNSDAPLPVKRKSALFTSSAKASCGKSESAGASNASERIRSMMSAQHWALTARRTGSHRPIRSRIPRQCMASSRTGVSAKTVRGKGERVSAASPPTMVSLACSDAGSKRRVSHRPKTSSTLARVWRTWVSTTTMSSSSRFFQNFQRERFDCVVVRRGKSAIDTRSSTVGDHLAERSFQDEIEKAAVVALAADDLACVEARRPRVATHDLLKPGRRRAICCRLREQRRGPDRCANRFSFSARELSEHAVPRATPLRARRVAARTPDATRRCHRLIKRRSANPVCLGSHRQGREWIEALRDLPLVRRRR